MTSAEATALFEKHDSYIKSHQYVQLSPTINNLDTIKTEFFPDGSKSARTTREWAANILSAEGNGSAHVDVVNAGYDQKSFQLMAPQHENSVHKAFKEYRSRGFPFSISEKRFRDAIGNLPAVIHVFSKVNANLSYIDKLFLSTELWKQSTAQSDQSVAEAELRADSSMTPGGAKDKFASNNNPFSVSGEPAQSSETKNDMHREKCHPLHPNHFRSNMDFVPRYRQKHLRTQTTLSTPDYHPCQRLLQNSNK